MENSARYSDFRDTVAYRAGTRFKEHGFAIANWLGQEVEETKRGHFTCDFWLLYDDPAPQPRRHWWSRTKKAKRLRVAHVLFDNYEADESSWLIEVYGEQHLGYIHYVATTVAASEGPDTTVAVRLVSEISHRENDLLRRAWG